MPVVAELRNVIVGDDTNWRAAAARTQESLVALQSQSAQSTAAIDASFAGIGASLAPAFSSIEAQLAQLIEVTSAGFRSMTGEVTAAMEQAAEVSRASLAEINASVINTAETAGAGFQTLGAQMETSMSEAAAGISVALKEVQASTIATSETVAGLGAVAQETGATINTAFAASGAGLNNLAASSVATSAAIGEVSVAAKLNRADLALLNTMYANVVAAQGADSAAAQMLAGELRAQGVAAGVAASGAGQLAGANVAEAASADVAGAATDRLNFQMRRHIGTMEGSVVGMRGMGMNLAFLSEAFGATSAASFVLFGAIAIGIIKLFEYLNATEKAVDVTAKLIDSNEELAVSYIHLRDSAVPYNQALADTALAYEKITEVDIIGLLRQYQQEQANADKATREGAAALDTFNRMRAQEADLIRRQSGNEQDLTSQKYKEAVATVEQGLQLENYRAVIGIAAAEQIKFSDAAAKTVARLVELTESGRLTQDQVKQLSDVGLISVQTFELYSDAVLHATDAQYQLNAAVKNFKPPALDASIKNIDQMRDSINKAIISGASISELHPRFEQLRKATAEVVAQTATLNGVQLKNAEAQKAVTAEMTKAGDATSMVAGQVVLYDRNLKAATSTQEKHAAAARTGHVALSEFKAGVEGLDKAITVTIAHLGDQSIFGALGKNAAKDAATIKDAARISAEAVNAFFEAMGRKAKATPESLLNLDKAIAIPLLRMAQTFKAFQIGLEAINFTRAAQGLDTLDDKIKIVGKTIEVNGETFLALPEQLKKGFEALGFTFQAVLPEVANGNRIFLEAMGVLRARNKEVLTDIEFELKTKGAQMKQDWDQIVDDLPIERFKAKLQELKIAIQSNPIFEQAKLNQEVQQTFDGVIRIMQQEGERMGKTQDQINQDIITSLSKLRADMPQELQAIGDAATRAWADSINKLPGALDNAINKMLDALGIFAAQSRIKVKGAVDGILLVMDAIPGKLHDIAQTFINWVNRIDQILHGLHKIFQQIPDGLGGVLQSVFTKVTQGTKDLADALGESVTSVMASLKTKVTQGTKDLAGALGESVESVLGSVGQGGSKAGSSFLSGFMGKVALIGSGIATYFSTRGANGAVTPASIAGAALAGAQIGAAFAGPFGAAIGAVIGTAIAGFHSKNVFVRFFTGGIFSAIFGGPTDAQKKAEEDAKKQVEAHIEQTTMEVLHTAFDAMQAAVELFEKLADFTVIPYKNIKRFFNQLDFLLQQFIQLSKSFEAGMADAAKAFAESIGPIVDVIGRSVEAFEKLGGFTGVAQVSIDLFSSAMTRVLQSFIGIKDKFLDAEGFIDTTVNQARKFAAKIGGVIDVIKNALDAFAGFTTFKNVLPETLDAFAATLKLAIEKMGDIAESVDKAMVKDAQRFSDRALSVVNLIKAGLDAFTPLATFVAAPSEALDAVFASIQQAVIKMIAMASAIDTTMLTLAASVATNASSIVNLIKNAIDAFASLDQVKSVAPEVFEILKNNIALAAQSIISIAATIDGQMLEGAATFADKAKNVVDLVKSAGDAFKDLSGVEAIGPEVFSTLAENIQIASEAIVAISNTIDTKMMAAAAVFAEKAKPLLELIKGGVDAFKDITSFAPVIPAAISSLASAIALAIDELAKVAVNQDQVALGLASTFAVSAQKVLAAVKEGVAAFKDIEQVGAVPVNAFFILGNAMEAAINKLAEISGEVSDAALTSALTFAVRAKAIFSTIKAGVDALVDLAKFQGVTPESFQLLLDGFNLAVNVLNQMLDRATQFETIAIAIESKLVSAAQHLKDGAAAMAAGVAAATTALSSSAPSGGTASTPTSAGLAPLSRAAASSTSSSATTISQPISVSVTVQGPLGTSIAQLQDYVVGAITEAQRRGRLATA